MSVSERRGRDRCPVCQGPTLASAQEPTEVRCRNSLCSYNHRHIPCTRCRHLGPDASKYDADGQFHYSCRECLHTWVQAKA